MDILPRWSPLLLVVTFGNLRDHVLYPGFGNISLIRLLFLITCRVVTGTITVGTPPASTFVRWQPFKPRSQSLHPQAMAHYLREITAGRDRLINLWDHMAEQSGPVVCWSDESGWLTWFVWGKIDSRRPRSHVDISTCNLQCTVKIMCTELLLLGFNIQ